MPNKKKFRPKLFDLAFFLLFWSFWAKNEKVPRKIIVIGKNLDFEIFVLKYVSKHSESFPTKKTSTKIF